MKLQEKLLNQENIKVLENSLLFNNISVEEINNLLHCLKPTIKEYNKGEYIFTTGQSVNTIGLVLDGNIIIENNDVWGNRNIIDTVTVGEIFGENYACIMNEPILVDVVSAKNSKVVFFEINKILNLCSNVCTYHNSIIKNLLTISSVKCLNLSKKILITTPKTIREKLLSYLSYVSKSMNSTTFDIPYNRQELADYLNVDRSALSYEISKMQKENFFINTKNHFQLLI